MPTTILNVIVISQVAFPKAKTDPEHIIYWGALLITLLHATPHVFTQFVQSTDRLKIERD
jgi:hypothetical protein